jgi:hypothetical protein
MLKKLAKAPGFTRDPIYLYRQHGSQTFGGILNFSGPAREFRANRLLDLIDAIEKEPRLNEGVILNFENLRQDNEYLSGRGGLMAIVAKKPSLKRVVRLIVQRRFPGLLRVLAVTKWRWEGRKR